MAESHPSSAPLEEQMQSDSENDEQKPQSPETAQDPAAPTASKSKKNKKRSKKSKLLSAVTGDKSTESGEASSSTSSTKPAAKLSDESIKTLLDINPSLKGELAGLSPDKAQEVLKKLDVSELLTGLSLNGKNQKDMASYKFWSTQPVVRFDEQRESATPDGPIKPVIRELVPKEAAPLPEGYEWVELDLNDDTEVKEVYNLLSHHYVEDDHAMFRFNYSAVFLDWALKSPEWKKSWHIGVRAKGASRLLVASIFGIPIKLKIRENVLDVVEINFMCVHKKLRSKRLAPVLIKEVTRRCHLDGIYQAIYTGGAILPTPVGSARYFHRSLDWLKLYEVGFSPLPPNTTQAKMVVRNQLPTTTSTKGLRPMQEQDIDAVYDLLTRYLARFELIQVFTKAEIKHWFLNYQNPQDQVVWSFVVEQEGKITDFASFYCLESTIIGAKKHDKIRAAYLYYYASDQAFNPKEKGLKERLQVLINDMLIEAKKVKFDVFNALTLHDNPLFLESLKFGAGDGHLHHYLYNWRTKAINAGVNAKNQPDETKRGGIGIVLL